MDINLTKQERDTFHQQYLMRRTEIKQRLREFNAVSPHDYFYELCYCLLTPQSKALHCNEVVRLLREHDFQNIDFDPEPFLHPQPSIYVRFHKTKAKRLRAMKFIFPEIDVVLSKKISDKSMRDELVAIVSGLGMKEASHFLRNIGKTNVTIIDRHILKNFVRYRIIPEYPKTISRKNYLLLERAFEAFADELHIPPDEFDLLLWSNETGFVLK